MRNSHDAQAVISDGLKGHNIEMQGRLPREYYSPRPNHPTPETK